MLEWACVEENKHVIEQGIVVDQLKRFAMRKLVTAVCVVEDFGESLTSRSVD